MNRDQLIAEAAVTGRASPELDMWRLSELVLRLYPGVEGEELKRCASAALTAWLGTR